MIRFRPPSINQTSFFSIYYTTFFTLFFLLNFSILYAAPPPQRRPTKNNWLAVERRPGVADAVLLRKLHCERVEEPCRRLLVAEPEWPNATATVYDGAPDARCVCRCPAKAPVFLQTAEKCAQKLGNCKKQIRFERVDEFDPKETFAEYIPLVSLPNSGEPINPALRIAWKESAVKVKAGVGPRCNVTEILYAASSSDRHGVAEWQTGEREWFSLTWMDNDVRIVWNDVANEGQNAAKLQGTIVRLNLNCAGGNHSVSKNAHCLAFRIQGQLDSKFISSEDAEIENIPQGFTSRHFKDQLPGRKFETLAILLLVILLFLSVFGSVLLWNVCWRKEKQKLIRSLQMHFMYLAKQEKEKAQTETQLRYHELVKAATAAAANSSSPGAIATFLNSTMANNGRLSPGTAAASSTAIYGQMDEQRVDGDTEAQLQQQPQQITVKRKLYFSPEFFEPQLMVNPPPMAEQFLFDLRRMILIARERIRTRRHVPRLGAIAELEDEKEEVQQQQQQPAVSAYKELVKAEKREPLKATQFQQQENRILEDQKAPSVGRASPPLQENIVSGSVVATEEELNDERDQLITMEEIVRQQQLLRQSLNAASTGGNIAAGEFSSSVTSSPRSTKSADDSGRGSDSKKDDADSDCSLGAESDASTTTKNTHVGDEEGNANKEKEHEELKQVPAPAIEATLAAKKVTELVREFESPRLQTKAEAQSNQQQQLPQQQQQQSRLITPRKIQHSVAKSALFQPTPILPPTTTAPIAPAVNIDQITNIVAAPTSRIPRVTATKSPKLPPKFSVATPSSDHQQPNPPNFPPPPVPSASAKSAPEQLRAEKLRDLANNGTNGHGGFGFSSSVSTAKKRPNAVLSSNGTSGLPTLSTTHAYAVYPSDSMKKSLPRRKKVHMSMAANGKGPTVV